MPNRNVGRRATAGACSRRVQLFPRPDRAGVPRTHQTSSVYPRPKTCPEATSPPTSPHPSPHPKPQPMPRQPTAAVRPAAPPGPKTAPPGTFAPATARYARQTAVGATWAFPSNARPGAGGAVASSASSRAVQRPSRPTSPAWSAAAWSRPRTGPRSLPWRDVRRRAAPMEATAPRTRSVAENIL